MHVSGIGADPTSASPYVRFRCLGDDAVRAACDTAAVLRPAVMIGAGDAFLTTLAGVILLPVVPLFGHGGTRLAPVYVGDVAEAAVIALTDPDPHAGISELGGRKPRLTATWCGGSPSTSDGARCFSPSRSPSGMRWQPRAESGQFEALFIASTRPMGRLPSRPSRPGSIRLLPGERFHRLTRITWR